MEEIFANAWWRTLQLRDFVDYDHKLTPWGIALADGLERLTSQSDRDLCEPLYLGLELFRQKVLHHEDFSVKYSGGPMHGSGASSKGSLTDNRH